MKNTIKSSQLEQLQYLIGNRINGDKIVRPNTYVHEFSIRFWSCKCSCQKTNTFSKRFVVQHHKLIINKHKYEHKTHHGKDKIEDIETSLYKYILSCKPSMYFYLLDTSDGFQFSVHSPLLALSMVADNCVLSIKNCQVNIFIACISV